MRKLGLVLVMMLLAGCGASFKGEPERSLDPTRDIVEYALEKSLSNTMIESALEAGATAAQRNAIIHARLTEIDRLYFTYERAITRELRETGFLTTLAILAVDAGGALTGSGSSQLLSAISGGITGTKQAFDKEILVDRTVQALTAQMRAGRDEMKARIYGRLGAEISSYPLLAALTDLVAYRQAGTLTGALLGISESASAAETEAREDLVVAEAVAFTFKRDAGFVAPKPQARAGNIAATLKDSDQVDDDQILKLANNPPARDSKFDDVLARFKPENAAFSEPALARAGLVIAIQELDRSEQNLAEWEKALNISN